MAGACCAEVGISVGVLCDLSLHLPVSVDQSCNIEYSHWGMMDLRKTGIIRQARDRLQCLLNGGMRRVLLELC